MEPRPRLHQLRGEAATTSRPFRQERLLQPIRTASAGRSRSRMRANPPATLRFRWELEMIDRHHRSFHPPPCACRPRVQSRSLSRPTREFRPSRRRTAGRRESSSRAEYDRGHTLSVTSQGTINTRNRGELHPDRSSRSGQSVSHRAVLAFFLRCTTQLLLGGRLEPA